MVLLKMESSGASCPGLIEAHALWLLRTRWRSHHPGLLAPASLKPVGGQEQPQG